MATDDVRYTAGILSLADSARFLDIPRQTFHRWARGDEHGEPLLHVLQQQAAEASVTFIALTEAHVLDALRDAGVRPQRIRPALSRLQKEFGTEYVLGPVSELRFDAARRPDGPRRRSRRST